MCVRVSALYKTFHVMMSMLVYDYAQWFVIISASSLSSTFSSSPLAGCHLLSPVLSPLGGCYLLSPVLQFPLAGCHLRCPVICSPLVGCHLLSPFPQSTLSVCIYFLQFSTLQWLAVIYFLQFFKIHWPSVHGSLQCTILFRCYVSLCDSDLSTCLILSNVCSLVLEICVHLQTRPL